MADLILPEFRYHPDPIASGSIITSDRKCQACNKVRGFIYTGAAYSERDLDEALCPWCIFNGTAHEVFGVEFVDPKAVGGYGVVQYAAAHAARPEFVDPKAVGGYGRWDSVPQSIVEEICFRTPSFNGWQQELWYTHCGDAAEFVAPVGALELRNLDSSLRTAIAEESGLSGETLAHYMDSLDRNLGPTAYAFRCRKCGVWGGYSDTH